MTTSDLLSMEKRRNVYLIGGFLNPNIKESNHMIISTRNVIYKIQNVIFLHLQLERLYLLSQKIFTQVQLILRHLDNFVDGF